MINLNKKWGKKALSLLLTAVMALTITPLTAIAGADHHAINTTGTGSVTIEGGTVRAESGLAVNAAGTFSMSGGVVFANSSETSLVGAVVNKLPAHTGEQKGIVIGWNNPGGSPIYAAGSRSNLLSDPAGNAKWNESPAGIANDKNDIIIEELGVTVNTVADYPVTISGSSAANIQNAIQNEINKAASLLTYRLGGRHLREMRICYPRPRLPARQHNNIF